MGGLPGLHEPRSREYDIAYLFIEGIAERIRPGQRREPMLAAWGFTVDGRKVLLHLMAGSKEDAVTVSAFYQDMLGRSVLISGAVAAEITTPLVPLGTRAARHRNACIVFTLSDA